MYIFTRSHSHIYIFTCSYIQTFTYSHIHTFTYSHVHTCTHSHVHTQHPCRVFCFLPFLHSSPSINIFLLFFLPLLQRFKRLTCVRSPTAPAERDASRWRWTRDVKRCRDKHGGVWGPSALLIISGRMIRPLLPICLPGLGDNKPVSLCGSIHWTHTHTHTVQNTHNCAHANVQYACMRTHTHGRFLTPYIFTHTHNT